MEIPLFPLHTVLCPGIVLPLHIFEDRYRALTRHCLDTGEPFGVVLIREGREVGARRRARPGRRRGAGRDPRGRRYPDGRYDLLAAATGRFAIETVDPAREPYLVADVTPLEDEVGDEARAERLAASAIRRFVRYLELMRARDGETSEVLDIRVEVDSSASSDDDDEPTDDDLTEIDALGGATTTTRAADDETAGSRARPATGAATWSSRTTRRSCPTCCPGSSRSSCRAARPCSRRRRRSTASRRWSACSTARSCCSASRLRLFSPDQRSLRRSPQELGTLSRPRRYSLKRSSFQGSASLL